MAFYIPIRKVNEDQASALYSYGVGAVRRDESKPPGRHAGAGAVVYVWGSFRIDKRSGLVELITLAEGDDRKMFFSRAARKVTQHWESGALPDTTCWAA